MVWKTRVFRWAVVLGALCATTAMFLAPMALADSFTSTFNLGSINVSDSSGGPPFLTGPFDYGFSLLGLNPAVVGQVNITSISVSAEALLNSTNPGFGNTAPSIGQSSLAPRHLGLRLGR